MEIQQTTDYAMFATINGNRNINFSKVEKICNDIQSGFNMLPYCPVIVTENNSKLNIIDGQHRFEASKKSGNPVYYVICQDLSLKQIALLNSRGDKWKALDFLNCYINLGIEDYKILKQFMKKHGIQIKTAIDLLMFNKHTFKSTDIFQSGDFQVRYYDEADKLLELVEDVFRRYSFSKDRYLIGAVQEIQKRGKCDFNELKQKIAAAPNIMDKNGDVKNYIYNIERVYNFKNSIRKVIY